MTAETGEFAAIVHPPKVSSNPYALADRKMPLLARVFMGLPPKPPTDPRRVVPGVIELH